MSILAATTDTLPFSAECTVAKRPGYEDLHTACRQTEDVPLPRAMGVLLVPRCGCMCHTQTESAS